MNERRIRNQKGAAITGLVIALFMFIMLAGFFAFDSSRLQMAQRELTATCDAASLAGTAMLTSLDIANDNASLDKLGVAQAQASAYARNMFQNGNMLGQSLGTANVVSPYSAVSAIGNPGDCNVMISLADPQNQFAGVAPTPAERSKGRAIMCYAGYTYNPVFLGVIGVGKVLLQAYSGGGLPQVDAVLVFDYSGSMDDATNVTFIRRTWDSTINSVGGASAGQWDYSVLTTPAVNADGGSGANPGIGHGVVHYIEVPPPGGISGSHRMSDYIQFDYVAQPNGFPLNVLPPQSLPTADHTNSMAAFKYILDFNLRTNSMPWHATAPKVGSPLAKFAKDFGTPPGNCTLSYPFGYGNFYNENPSSPTYTPMTFAAGPTGNAAYNPNALFAGSVMLPEHPMSAGTAFRYPAYVNTGGDQHIFTDLVVNIANPGSWPYAQPLNGPNNFVGFTFTFPSQEPDGALAGRTFSFDNIGVLTEAARGNLDIQAGTNYFTDALLDRGSFFSTTSGTIVSKQSTGMTSALRRENYQKAYQRLAMLYSQPIATAIDGAYGGFFQKINTLTDCRFGLVGFSNSSQSLANPSGPNFTSQGSAHSTVNDQPNSFFTTAQYYPRPIGSRYRSTNFLNNSQYNDPIASGGGTGFRQPRRALAKSELQTTSYAGVVGGLQSSTLNGVCAPWSALATSAIANGLENGTPLSDTATAEALVTARAMFHNGANYDIGTLTNNRPAAKHAIVFFTDGVPNAGDAGPTLTEAQGCKGEGIAIFTIGLDVTGNPVLQGSQITFLGNLPSGLAGASGNGGKFFQCASASTVKDSFSAVARRLAQGQR